MCCATRGSVEAETSLVTAEAGAEVETGLVMAEAEAGVEVETGLVMAEAEAGSVMADSETGSVTVEVETGAEEEGAAGVAARMGDSFLGRAHNPALQRRHSASPFNF
jgi:hypothetical protein